MILSFAGMLLGVGCVLVVMHRAGIIGIVLNLDAFLLVYGGTLASMMITYPWSLLRRVPNALRNAFFPAKSEEPEAMISSLVHLSELAKRGGVDALEAEIPSVQNRFLADGLRMVVDGVPPELVRDNMEKTITFTRVRHQQLSNVFKTMGTYSPVFGLLGTLIGVVQILNDISDMDSLGKAMAVAVTATFYGIFGANFIFLPIAGKLNALSDAEMLLREVAIEGVLAVQAQEVPAVVSLKLQAYLSTRLREQKDRPPLQVANAG